MGNICDKCGEERTPVCGRGCKGDAAWTFAEDTTVELLHVIPCLPTTDLEPIIARNARLFLRKQVFEMGDAETKRLLGEVAHDSFADRGRTAARAALNRAMLTVLIEKTQAVVNHLTLLIDNWNPNDTKDHLIAARDALAAVLPQKEKTGA